jgi:hypothetical protein
MDFLFTLGTDNTCIYSSIRALQCSVPHSRRKLHNTSDEESGGEDHAVDGGNDDDFETNPKPRKGNHPHPAFPKKI